MAELEERKEPQAEGETEASRETPVAPAPQGPNGGGTGGGFRSAAMRMLLGLVVLALAASTLYLLAERNSRFYFLSQEGNSLVVSRGAWLPSGKRPYLPDDPRSAQIYAPITLPADVEPIAEQRFSERQDLDRALFELLADLATPRIRSDRMETLQQGFGLVERAGLLPGISADQAARLRTLQAELSYFEGRAHLQEAVILLRQAREKLELATEASSERAEEAAILLRRLAPASQVLSRALQQAQGWAVDEPSEEENLGEKAVPEDDARGEPPAQRPAAERPAATSERARRQAPRPAPASTTAAPGAGASQREPAAPVNESPSTEDGAEADAPPPVDADR